MSAISPLKPRKCEVGDRVKQCEGVEGIIMEIVSPDEFQVRWDDGESRVWEDEVELIEGK